MSPACRALVSICLVQGLLACQASGDASSPGGGEADVDARLRALSPSEWPAPPEDRTNAYADDPRAAELGQKLFHDPRFSGQLLDEDNDGAPGTLGLQGEAGRVSCESCHNASNAFLDARSPRSQISLGSGWTRRRSPSLLGVGHAKLLMWDGRRDTMYNQIFGVIESPLEFNSSRLFVAQQIARYYADEYEQVFGAPPLGPDEYDSIEPADAGCTELPEDPLNTKCIKPGQDDRDVTRVVVNMGKAIGAYERLLECGQSRFDHWMQGDAEALNADEQAGAVLFVSSGCDNCHSGPMFTDQEFHNVGSANLQNNFIEPFEDPGAANGLPGAVDDALNARGEFSDGDDGRLDAIPEDASGMLGAFRTPSLRCVDQRPSFMHAAQKRSLEDVVNFFDRGGDSFGYEGTKDPLMVPLGLTATERAQLTAFLRALTGEGPPSELLEAPELPE